MPQGVSIVYLALLFLCLLLSAFFSGSEAAFLSIQRLRLRHLVDKRVPRAQRVARLAEHPEQFLPTVLLGNTLVNTAIATLGAAVTISFIRSQQTALLVATVGVSALVLVFGEMLPKTIATRHAEGTAFLVVRFLDWFRFLLFPLTVLLHWTSHLVVRSFGGSGGLRTITEEEVKSVILMGHEAGAVEHEEARIMANVLRLGEREVREVMTPRPDIVWVEQGTPLGEFLALYAHTPHSRYPVYARSVDNIVGILWIRDVLGAMAEGRLHDGGDVTALARRPFFTPETKKIGPLFQEMRKTGESLAVAVDEFGGVAGIVSITQLLEELVGPLPEEGGHVEQEVVELGAGAYEVDAGMRVEEANQQLGLLIPEGEYETLAGFVLSVLGRVPRPGESLLHEGVRFVIASMDGVKIEKLRITKVVRAQQQRQAAL
ncbi:MAG: HlyC/CorC family transporter [Chloroflexi bacterium]|nr:HlyC/CorC family transporter [Chloroflexota bacterium]